MSALPKPQTHREPEYLKWLGKQPCALYRLSPRVCSQYRTEAAHVGKTGKGMAQKCDDREALPLCQHHHAQQHQKGIRTFEATYQIDLILKAFTYYQKFTEERESWNQNAVRAVAETASAQITSAVDASETTLATTSTSPTTTSAGSALDVTTCLSQQRTSTDGHQSTESEQSKRSNQMVITEMMKKMTKAISGHRESNCSFPHMFERFSDEQVQSGLRCVHCQAPVWKVEDHV